MIFDFMLMHKDNKIPATTPCTDMKMLSLHGKISKKMDIDDYISAHIDPEPEPLAELYRHTHLHHLYPRMCSGHIQGRILRMLTAMAAPQRILELGTFTGYSALCFAEGMPAGCKLHTVEIDDEMEPELRARFAASERAADIELHIGDALTVVPGLDCHAPWDMVFIDADKRRYPDYYRMLLPRVRPGGFILADNTLWSNKMLDPEGCTDPQSRGIAEFNRMVADDRSVETVILPLRDGLTILRKKA